MDFNNKIKDLYPNKIYCTDYLKFTDMDMDLNYIIKYLPGIFLTSVIKTYIHNYLMNKLFNE